MRKAERRADAKRWLDSGKQMTVKMYAKRYGVDRYTAREDLDAIGFKFAPEDTRWSKRPEPVPHKAKAVDDLGPGPDWACVGGRLMFVVGYTPGGAPYGCYAEELDHDEGGFLPAEPC